MASGLTCPLAIPHTVYMTTTLRTVLASAVLATLAVLAPSAAQDAAPAAASTTAQHQQYRQNQGDSGATFWPVVDAPVGNRYGTGQTTWLALDAPHDAWGHALRRFAAYVNTQHLGVRVLLHHTCSEAPSDPCVHLRETAPADCGCYAQEVDMGQPMSRLIQVRPDVHTNFYAIVAHEFGHVLGLEHHDQHGVDGAWPNEVTFSSAEHKALVAMYVWNHAPQGT